MHDKVSLLRQQFQADFSKIAQAKDVEEIKVKYLGKKGPIQELMQDLRTVSADERPLMGKLINDLKVEITHLCEKGLEGLGAAEEAKRIEEEKIDVTLPGRTQFVGKKHPVNLLLDEVLSIFKGMGFSVHYGPDIDSDYYNYEGLNFPKDHPARDMQDTFYITPDMLLRSHTSNTQLRIMEAHKPPLRVVMPGTVYRNEDISARSHVFFHQVEGMYIDKHVSFADLFATMHEFWSKLFKTDVVTRFRPSYFPFVEPGLEVDIKCTTCGGSGCRLCKHTGWLEVVGAGMIHPEVLKNGGIDPEVYSGFAWGFGMERLALLLYGITDIRAFTQNDLKLLQQF